MVGESTALQDAFLLADDVLRQVSPSIVKLPMLWSQACRNLSADMCLVSQTLICKIQIKNQRQISQSTQLARVRAYLVLTTMDVLQGVQGISDIITIPGLVNVDFADVKAVMCNSGTAMLGVGVSSGKNRAEEAATVSFSHRQFNSGALNLSGTALMTSTEALSMENVGPRATSTCIRLIQSSSVPLSSDLS